MGLQKMVIQTERDVHYKQTKTIYIEGDFTQIYHSMQEIAAHIYSVSTYKLLFWLLANAANRDNGFVGSKILYEKFNKYLKEHCNKCTISYRTFINCMNELKDAKAVNQVGRGHYYFNPYVIWRDDKASRQDFIEAEYKDGKPSFNPTKEDHPLTIEAQREIE